MMRILSTCLLILFSWMLGVDAQGNVTIAITKNPTTNVISTGKVFAYSITLSFPLGLSSVISLEIFTAKDNNTGNSVVQLCSPKVTLPAGSTLTGVNTVELNRQWQFDSLPSSKMIDHAWLYLNNITQNGQAISGSNAALTISFNALTSDSSLLATGLAYVDSVGFQVVDQQRIWIGQSSYTWAATTFPYFTNHTATLTSRMPGTLSPTVQRGTYLVYRLSLGLYQVLNKVFLEIYAASNLTYDVPLHIDDVRFPPTQGAAYDCWQRWSNITVLTSKTIPRTNFVATQAVKFDMGSVINDMRMNGLTPQLQDEVLNIDIRLLLTSNSSANAKYLFWVGTNLNGQQIFLRSDLITAANANLLSTLTAPAPDIYLYSFNNVMQVTSISAAFLNLTIPTLTQQYFTVEFYFSENVTSNMIIDRVRVLHIGSNFPKNYTITNSSITRNSTANNGLINYARVDMGLVSNLGTIELADNEWPSNIVLEVVIVNVDIESGAMMDTVDLVTAVTYANNYWVDKETFTILNNVSANNSYMKPNVYVYWPDGAGNTTYQGSSILAIMDVEIPLQTYIYPFSLNVYGLFDTKAIMSVCSVTLVSLGEYVMGIDNSAVVVTLGSTNNDFRTDMATVSFTKFASNIGRWYYPWEKLRHVARFEIKLVMNGFVLYSTDNLLLNQSYYLAVMGYLVNNTLYMGTLTYEYSNTTKMMAVGTAPTITESVTPSGSANLAPGDLYQAKYHVTTAWKSVYGMLVTVSSPDSSMRICDVRRSNVGSCLGCLTDYSDVAYTIDPIYGPVAAFADYGNIVNLAYDRNVSADNSFDVTVIAMRNNDPSSNTLSLTTSFKLGATSKGFSLNTNNYRGTATASSAFTNSTTIVQVRNGTTSLIIGAFNLLTATVIVPRVPNPNSYTVTFVVPLEASDPNVSFYVCTPYLLSAGSNLPCTNDAWANRNITYDVPGDPTSQATVVLDLSLVPNLNKAGSSDLDTFQVELPVMPLNTTPSGSTAEIGYTIKSGSHVVTDGILNLTMTSVIPTPNYTPIIYTSPPMNNTPVPLNIFSNITYTINFTLAESAFRFKMRATSLDTNQGAILAFYGVNFVQIGYNYPCWDLQRPVITFNSSEGSTATDQMDLDGIITHIGRSRRDSFHRHLNEDDLLSFQFAVVLMDRVNIVNQSTYNYTLDFYFGNTIRRSFNLSIRANITGIERPYLATTGYTSSYVPADTHPGDSVIMYASVNHTSYSGRNAYNVSYVYYLPDVIQFIDVVSWFPFTGTFQLLSSKNALIINVPRIIYTDNFTVAINVTLDPNSVLDPKLSQVTIMVPQQVSFERASKSGFYTSGPTAFGLQFNVSREQVPLGMASGSIQDCQITSTSYAKTYMAKYCRPTSLSGWSPGIRKAPFSGNEYLQIALGNLTRVEAVTIYPGNDNGTRQEITSFALAAATCGVVFQDVIDAYTNQPKIYQVDLSRKTSTFVRISPSVEARSIRIIPKSISDYSTLPMFRVELWGSASTSDVSVNDVCAASNAHQDYYSRGYLVDTDFNRIWVCISIDNENGSRCSASFDNGVTWIIMPELVHCVTMLHLKDRQLWGIGSNRNSRVRSDDNGVTWVVTTEDEYNSVAALSSNLVRKVTLISWDNLDSLSPAELKSAYGFSLSGNRYFSVNISGIVYYDGTQLNQIAYWGTEPWGQ